MATPARVGTHSVVQNSANSGSTSVTVGSGADLCVCTLSFFHSGTPTLAMTLGGQSLVQRQYFQDSNGGLGLFTLDVSAMSGSQTFAWDFSGTAAVDEGTNFVLTWLDNVDLTNPVTDSDVQTHYADDPGSVTLTGGDSSHLVIGGCGCYQEGANAAPAGSNQTQYTTITAYNNNDHECAEEAGAASVTFSVTTLYYGVAAAMIKGSADGAAGQPYIKRLGGIPFAAGSWRGRW